MKIYKEDSLTNFEFWSGARANAEQLTIEELEQLDDELQELYTDGMDETSINDLFWFEFETVCGWLGLELDENGDIIRK